MDLVEFHGCQNSEILKNLCRKEMWEIRLNENGRHHVNSKLYKAEPISYNVWNELYSKQRGLLIVSSLNNEFCLNCILTEPFIWR